MRSYKSSFLTIFFVLAFGFCKSQNQNFQWVNQFGGIGEEYGFGIAVDDSSNSYVTGYVDAENNLRHIAGACINHDIFIAKYNSTGAVIWNKQLGGEADDSGWAIATDKDQNVYVTGTFQDTLFLSTGDLISTDFKDIFVAKFNSAGDLLWAKKAGGSMVNNGCSICTDSQNKIYITGSFDGTTQFENTFITSRGSKDAFLAKYDSDGNLEWVINEGGSIQNDEAFAVSTDKNDNVYVCGKFEDTAYFSSDTLISKGSSDYFIAKHSSSGNLLWVKSAGGTSMDVAQALSCDQQGNIYLTGYFNSMADFDGMLLTSTGSSDVFVVKYDTSGNIIWTRGSGGNGPDQGTGITSRNGKIYGVGYFYNNATFGSSTISSSGYADIFITCLDSIGNFKWTKNCGGSDNDAGSSISSDTAGNVFVTGTFSSMSTFGNYAVTSAGDKDLFIAKIGSEISVGFVPIAHNEDQLIVYPNPTSGSSKISIYSNDNSSRSSIYLINEIGQQIFQKEFVTPEIAIDLDGLPKGIYFLKADINGSMYLKKIILN